MKLTTIALAATIAAAPFAANAITFGEASDGGSFFIGTCAGGADLWNDAVVGTGSAGSYSADFASCTTPANGGAEVTIGTGVSGTFQNLAVAWENGDSVQITDAGFNLLPGNVFELFTEFTATTNPQALTFTWDASSKGAKFDFEVTATPVPLPAGILLLGTAIAGLGFARRKA